jgi:hypothetical protein
MIILTSADITFPYSINYNVGFDEDRVKGTTVLDVCRNSGI